MFQVQGVGFRIESPGEYRKECTQLGCKASARRVRVQGQDFRLWGLVVLQGVCMGSVSANEENPTPFDKDYALATPETMKGMWWRLSDRRHTGA